MSFPSTFLDLQNEVIRAVRLDATADLQKAKDWVNQAYSMACIHTEATAAHGTAVLTAGSATYTLPTSILRIKEIVAAPSGQTAYGLPLTETTLSDILAWRENGSTGTPTNYTLFGYTQLELYPTPSAADGLLIYYIAAPTALSADGDVPVLQEPYGSYVIKYGAMAEAANFLKDPSEQEYRALYDKNLRMYQGHLNRRRGGHTLSLSVGNGWVIPNDNSVDLGAWR